MPLFKKRKNTDLNSTIVDYVNSILPPSVYCIANECKDGMHYLTIANNSRAIKIEFEVDGVSETYKLTDQDKVNINAQVLVPILRALDKELQSVREEIHRTLSKIESVE